MCILAVNKQIFDEAAGIFYHNNSFEFDYPSRFHAFTLSLGTQRLSLLRDITLHYQNNKMGDINSIDLTMPLLRQLHSLRRFHIVFHGDLMNRIKRRLFNRPYDIERANPAELPGMKFLFTLRGITDIKIRDMDLEISLELMKKDKDYPDYVQGTRSYNLVKLHHIVEYFNGALADAQNGKVNKTLLEDDKWHLQDPFPTS